MTSKEQRSLILFGQRLKAIREAAGLSQAYVRHFTEISHILRIEAGTLSTGIHNVSKLAELFGMEDHELFQYKSPIPDPDLLRKSVSRYLKSRDIDPAVFLKESAVHYIETKLLPSKFFSSPRFTKEISEYFQEKHSVKFTTTRLSQALESFVRKGLVEKLETEAKTKYKYQRKG